MPKLFQSVRLQLLNHRITDPLIRGPILILNDDATDPAFYTAMVTDANGYVRDHRVKMTTDQVVDLIEEWADKEPW